MKFPTSWRATMLRHLRNRDVVIPGVSALAAGFLTLWTTANHMVLKYDSVFYLSATESLARWDGFLDHEGRQLTNFPPGLPLIYRVFMIFGLDSLQAARIVGVVASSLIVVLVAIIAHRIGPRGSASVAALVMTAVPGMIVMNTQVMSEPAFVVALLALVIGLIRLPVPPAILTWRDLMPVIVASWLCGLIRYQGYAVLVAVAAVLFLRSHPWKERFWLTTKYSVLAGIVVLVNIAQSQARADEIGIPITPAKGSASRDVEVALSSIGQTLSLDSGPLGSVGDQVLGIVTLLVLGGLFAYIVWITRWQKRFPQTLVVLNLLGTLAIFTFVSARRVWVELTPRMIFPMLPLTIILIAVAVVALAGHLTRRMKVPLVLLGGLVTVLLAAQSIATAQDIHAQVRGLNTAEQQVPELGRAVAELDPSVEVYSNNTEGIWLSSRRPRVRALEQWARYVSRLYVEDAPNPPPDYLLDDLWNFSRDLCDGFYYARTDWRHSKRTTGKLDQVEDVATIDVVQEFDGGTLYYLTSSVPELCTSVEQYFAQNS